MNNAKNGLGFLQVLTLIFITLKLTEVITWSWWLVLAPLWIPLGIALVVIICIALYITFSKTNKNT